MTAGDASNSPLEYQALRDGCGFVELAGWSSVTVTGADRKTFLQNFCTNDVARLALGESCEAFFTNVKGKILAHGLVDCREDAMVFISVPGQSAGLIDHLDRYIIREDVQLRDSTIERSYLLVAGGAATGETVGRVAADGPARWIAWDMLNRPTCGLLESSLAELPRLRQKLVECGAMDCDLATFETLRIEAGMPLYGIDFDEHNLPQEVDRNERAISFTKGCYLGQETVARIDAVGHVNQQLAGVRFENEAIPLRGTELKHADANAGRVTSATFSPALGAPLALAMVRRESHKPGTQLESRGGPCQVVALPVNRAGE